MLYIEGITRYQLVFQYHNVFQINIEMAASCKQAYHILYINNMFGTNVADTCHRSRVKHFLCQISKNTLHSSEVEKLNLMD